MSVMDVSCRCCEDEPRKRPVAAVVPAATRRTAAALPLASIGPRAGARSPEGSLPRYIILDNVTGSIVADTLDLDGPPREEGPLEAVRRFDALTLEDERSYAEEHPSAALNNVLGYLVYLAPDTFPKVKDGEDQDVIDAMIEACEPVAFVEVREL
jgi:hypothetical protein